MTTSNAFTSLLNVLPIIQAPMAGVASPQLAAAVSNAGALGSLGLGASTADQGRRMIQETRALTSRPFNVNVFCHAPAVRDATREATWLAHLSPLFSALGAKAPDALDEIYRSFIDGDDMFEMLLEEKPAVVSVHFGLPTSRQIKALRSAGIYTMATATNLSEAALIETASVDAIIAQGIEAGGHRGMFDVSATDEGLSTAVLVRLLASRTTLPIIAAGGIMDGQGIRAALDLGADAAQLGTAFVLCPESSANAAYRTALKSEDAAVTRLTSVLSGRPARGIVNRLITIGESDGSPTPAAYPLAYDAAKQLNAIGAAQGNHAFAAHWAGQGAPLAREMPAKELVSTLLRELKAAAAER